MAVLARHHEPFWHRVSAAIRCRDGRIFTGIHLGASVGRLSICAEPIALGRAILEGDGSIVTSVAVRHPKADEADQSMAVVPPCGACRDLVMDHAPEANVLLRGPSGLIKLPMRVMLPLPYQR